MYAQFMKKNIIRIRVNNSKFHVFSLQIKKCYLALTGNIFCN